MQSKNQIRVSDFSIYKEINNSNRIKSNAQTHTIGSQQHYHDSTIFYRLKPAIEYAN